MPPTLVPDYVRGCFHVVDGFGRIVASQVVNKEKYKTMECLVLLNAPKEEGETLKFEAELYAFQNKNVKPVVMVQTHGARLILKDQVAETIEKYADEYGYAYVSSQGKRDAGILGSYNVAYNIIKANGEICWKYLMSICEKSGFNRKQNGYCRAVLNSMRDIWKLYPESRETTEAFMCEYLRKITPSELQANAVSRYPSLSNELAMRLYVEDECVDKLGLKHQRKVYENKLVFI